MPFRDPWGNHRSKSGGEFIPREDDVKIPNKGFAIFGWEKIYDVFILGGFMDQNVMSSWVVMIAGLSHPNT